MASGVDGGTTPPFDGSISRDTGAADVPNDIYDSPPPPDASDFDASAGGDAGAPARLSVSLGLFHTCAALADGTARCWGNNDFGQLGDGTTMGRVIPTLVPGIADVTDVFAGMQQTCVLHRDRTVSCWGANDEGQLADGTTMTQLSAVRATALPGDVVDLALGGIHSTSGIELGHACSVHGDGTVRCWGANSVGQLGDETTMDRIAPAVVAGISGARRIVAGLEASCALLSDGTVTCWGGNRWGELGTAPSTESMRTAPGAVAGVSGAIELSAGLGHVCALVSDGTLICWGVDVASASAGGLGILATTVESHLPTLLASPITISAIGVGGTHTCVAWSDGTGGCFGNNQLGQLGDGTTARRTMLTPLAGGLPPLRAVRAGVAHTCAIATEDRLYCWGFNMYGNLGDGTTTQQLTPVLVPF